MKDFFISYNKADKNWAEWIAWTLEEAGYSVVIQAWDFRPGGNFVLEMNEASMGTEHTIAVLSEDYLNADFTQPEWAAVFKRDPQGKTRRLIPIRVKKCDPEGLLGPTIYIDLLNLTEEEARREIFEGLKERAKPDEAPAFPAPSQRPSVPVSERVVPNKVQFPGIGEGGANASPDSGVLWNVPQGVQFFTGREDVLEQLHKTLTTSNAAVIAQRQAISGLGGIGKTQTAIEYANRYRKEYKAVLWAVAESKDSLISNFVDIAAVLGLPEKNIEDQSLTINAVKRWLESNTGWLLIIDNADEPEIIEDFLPKSSNGHVLLTSRKQVFDTIGILNPLELEEMLPDDAIKFLLKRTGRSDLEPNEEKAIVQLAGELDYLPLALEQAGAYIKQLRSSFQDYLDSFHQRGIELLEKGQLVGKYRKSVRTTWSLNFQQVEQASKASADLLRVSAFLNPDRIPVELITNGATELGPELSAALSNVKTDPLVFDEVISPLIQYSLIHRDRATKTYDIHRLVQAVLKDGMDETLKGAWAERVVKAMAHTFPDIDTISQEQWGNTDRLLPHAQVCIDLIGTWNLEFLEAANLLNLVGRYLHLRARLDEAEALYTASLSIREKHLGSTHLDVAISLHNLAWLYSDQGKYKESEALYLKSLNIQEQLLSPMDLALATSYLMLGILYSYQARYKEAEQILTKALEIRENRLGINHHLTAEVMSHLSKVYYLQDKLIKAEELYSKTLQIQDKVLEPNHHQIATTLEGLAMTYRRQNRISEAEPLMLRALSILERAVGINYPRLNAPLTNLALLYIAQNRFAEAKKLLDRAIHIIETTLGPKHPEITFSLFILGDWHYLQSNFSEAEQLYNRAFIIREKTFDSNHPGLAHILIALGKLYLKQHKYIKGEQYLKRATPILRQTYGNENRYVADALSTHASLLKGMNRKGEAQKLEAQARKIWAKVNKKEREDKRHSS